MLPSAPQPTDWWTVTEGEGPIVGTAIHEGHHVRDDLTKRFLLSAEERRREEDPFTEHAIRAVPNRIVVHRSRFEVDLNRAPDEAVYLSPEQAWDLEIWREKPGEEAVARSLRFHARYYDMLGQMLSRIIERHGVCLLLDMHSYNHRRDGPDAAPTPPAEAPEINIGTFSMPRERWQHVLDPFMEALRAFDFRGRRLDVRENVAFQGKGYQTRFVHEAFPKQACAIAIEFKKFFMDEWTGEPNGDDLREMQRLIASTLPMLSDLLSGSGAVR